MHNFFFFEFLIAMIYMCVTIPFYGCCWVPVLLAHLVITADLE